MALCSLHVSWLPPPVQPPSGGLPPLTAGSLEGLVAVLCMAGVQVRVPRSGARVILASDGVWDAFDTMGRVGALARHWDTEVSL